MSSEPIVINVENLGKCYEIYQTPPDRLKQMIFPRLLKHFGRHQTFYSELWALKDINFEVRKGQTVGILGRNGSGKSTLLQIIAGTLTPTCGNVDVHGRVAAMLELGSGFNPEFTGLENVFLSASLLGLTRDETTAKLDDILSFANIGDFVNQPVKTYSSGMMLRLAFAVQVVIETELLIIDEALAVGDARFQLKCFKRLDQLKKNGTTILFVSHAIDTVRSICEYGLVLDKGRSVYWGEAKLAATKYYELLFPDKDADENSSNSSVEAIVEDRSDFEKRASASRDDVSHELLSFSKDDLKKSWGLGGATIDSIDVVGITAPNIIQRGQLLTYIVKVTIDLNLIKSVEEQENVDRNLYIGIRLDNGKGVTLFDLYEEVTSKQSLSVDLERETGVSIQIDFEVPELCGGEYYLSPGVALGTLDYLVPLWSCDDAIALYMVPDKKITGLMKPNYSFRRMEEG